MVDCHMCLALTPLWRGKRSPATFRSISANVSAAANGGVPFQTWSRLLQSRDAPQLLVALLKRLSLRSPASTSTGTRLAVLVPVLHRAGCRLHADLRALVTYSPYTKRKWIIMSLIPTGVPAGCSSSKRPRVNPTIISNAAMIIDAAHIGAAVNIARRCYRVTRFRAARSAFARDLSYSTRSNCRSRAYAGQIGRIWCQG